MVGVEEELGYLSLHVSVFLGLCLSLSLSVVSSPLSHTDMTGLKPFVLLKKIKTPPFPFPLC